jgi:hypothetical protein
VLAVALTAAPLAAQEATLRYRWTAGEEVRYRISLETNSIVSGMPGMGDMTVDQTLAQVIKIAVADVAADGTATLRQTFESVKMDMNGPMGRIAYDTASPPTAPNPMTEPLKQVLGAMVGQTITVVQAPDGTVRKVEGASAIVARITSGMPQDPAAAALTQGLKSMLSDDAMRATLEQSFSKLPAGPVKSGDTWNGEISIGNDMIGKINGAVTFTLKALEGPADAALARIAVSMVMKQVTAPPAGPNDMKVQLGDSRGQGEMTFDVARGRIRRSTMKTDMPSTVTMTGPDGTVDMRNKSTTTMTMELIEK